MAERGPVLPLAPEPPHRPDRFPRRLGHQRLDRQQRAHPPLCRPPRRKRLRRDGATPNGDALPGYYTINLSAVQKIAVFTSKPTELRLDVINLLDRRYKIRDGTGIGVGAPQYGLRRAVLAGVTQHF